MNLINSQLNINKLSIECYSTYENKCKIKYFYLKFIFIRN